MCMYMCVRVCLGMCTWVQVSTETRSIKSLELEYMQLCATLNACWNPNVGPLSRQYVSLTTDPCPPLPHTLFNLTAEQPETLILLESGSHTQKWSSLHDLLVPRHSDCKWSFSLFLEERGGVF